MLSRRKLIDGIISGSCAGATVPVWPHLLPEGKNEEFILRRGRFQPMHPGHMEIIEQALSRSPTQIVV